MNIKISFGISYVRSYLRSVFHQFPWKMYFHSSNAVVFCRVLLLLMFCSVPFIFAVCIYSSLFLFHCHCISIVGFQWLWEQKKMKEMYSSPHRQMYAIQTLVIITRDFVLLRVAICEKEEEEKSAEERWSYVREIIEAQQVSKRTGESDGYFFFFQYQRYTVHTEPETSKNSWFMMWCDVMWRGLIMISSHCTLISLLISGSRKQKNQREKFHHMLVSIKSIEIVFWMRFSSRMDSGDEFIGQFWIFPQIIAFFSIAEQSTKATTRYTIQIFCKQVFQIFIFGRLKIIQFIC